MGKGKRRFWLILRRVFTAAAVAILAALSCNSTISVEHGGQLYQQTVSLFEKRGAFEDSELFNEILADEVQDVTRLAVIRSQLETDGAYDGQREIDIAQYAHRQEELPDTGITANYYLDDLVKWGNYGFVTEKVYATEDELNSYFANGTSAFSMQNEMMAGDWKSQSQITRDLLKELTQGSGEDTLSMRMIRELPSSREDYKKMAAELGKYVEDSMIVELDILVPRYTSADGLDLAEYASDMDEYVQLREDLKTTSRELFYNFTEYSEKKDAWSPEVSNLRYCYRMTVDGQIRYFSNLEGDFSEKKLEEITRQFENYGRYIYYNADRSELYTDTGIDAEQMRQEMGYYQYAFGDNTRVWMAVDADYPANDSFLAAREAYNSVMPYYGYLAAACALFALFSLAILIYLTRFEGRINETKGAAPARATGLSRCDRILTEPFVLLGAGLIGLTVGLFYLAYAFCLGSMEDVLHTVWFPFAVGAAAYVLDEVCMFVYLSLVRRARAHTLWSNSLLLLLLRRTRRGVLSLYDNSHILARTLVPFVLLLAANLVLGGCGVAGILAAAAVDVAAILLLYGSKKDQRRIVEVAIRIGRGDFDRKVNLTRLHGDNRELAEAVNGIGDGIRTAVEKSMKDERLKADLITNVSHDIKTPLTSIINFVSLLKREKIDNPRAQGYIQVLDAKSQRLKQLTDDLVEASKISSGNISLQLERLDFKELVNQTCGEFDDKFKEKCLEMVVAEPEGPVYIEADSRRLWRVVENLFSNACKYALEGTRVYLDIRKVRQDGQETAVFSMKNISAQALNIRAEELTERFIRGDISRSTEGSGLGLSIAQNLTQLQKGRFEIYLDGDLFKVILAFPCLPEKDG
ncbi:MAG: HAMP domain-containing sensor histidine kinase [Eubacteriales bacterium]|nr:HAMP domain-containing sensor histidine kinase [Eubacteriales bacterium]